ncbi:MAG TPA: 4Fe-4S dicluster domain-containing protein [Methanothermococcus okinawensis]|uniref:4Fe-4S dicluster domain-containing protein n=1 Tax=Methanothermococcus okinawensis TaxID=155863 RepID=A0A833DRL7_9EURY|nr:4Fe-4S dicluster domain-containing protein [Methanothermococcus okinawensis]
MLLSKIKKDGFMPLEIISTEDIIKGHFKDKNLNSIDLTLDEKIIKKRIGIDNEKCITCNVCVEVCPLKIISSNIPSSPKINHKKCVYCFSCVETCPVKAISIKYLIGRIVKNYLIVNSHGKNEELIYNNKKCIMCLACKKNCPFGVIYESEGRIKFDMKKCTLCGYCGYLCPPNAIDFKGPIK